MAEVDPILAGNDREAAAAYVAQHSKLVNKVSDGTYKVTIDGQRLPVNQDRVDYRDPENSPRAGSLSELQQGVRDTPRAQGNASAGEETPAVLLSPKAPEAPRQAQPQPPTPWPRASTRETPTPQAPAQQPAPQTPQAPAPQLVELEIGGSTVRLPREVAAKLVQQGQQVEQAQELMRRAQAVRDDTTLDVVASGAYRQATPEMRREFMDWMRKAGGAVAAPSAQPGLDAEGEFAAQPPAPQPAQVPAGLAEMQQNLRVLTQDLQERRAHEARSSAEQWVTQQIAQTPVFAENPGLRQLAERDVRQAIAMNPRVDPAALVARAATFYTQVATTMRGAPQPAPPAAMQGRGATAPLAPTAAPPTDRPAFTGKDLLTGRIKSALKRALLG